MSFINYAARELSCKIVYYGPGLGGKTTNLKYLHRTVKGNAKGELVSLATSADRTLFFDFMPLELAGVGDYKVRFHLYTVPGQIFYEASRRVLLEGADGVVFVADSQRERMDANLESLRSLKDNLLSHGIDFNTIPYALQLNKRDLFGTMSAEDMKRSLVQRDEPVLESVATEGTGVVDTFKYIARTILQRLQPLVSGGTYRPEYHSRGERSSA